MNKLQAYLAKNMELYRKKRDFPTPHLQRRQERLINSISAVIKENRSGCSLLEKDSL